MREQEPLSEPWMRVFFSFQMVREDLAHHTAGLSTEQVWARTGALPSLGFHLRHLAGSVERLTAYLMEEPLTPAQLEALKEEPTPGATLAALLAGVDASLAACEARLRTIRPEQIHAPRFIGRKRLPTTVLGLLVHLAEHTQRHLGQAITTAKLART
jgi:uncharacterized damage-inducible protein DinB